MSIAKPLVALGVTAAVAVGAATSASASPASIEWTWYIGNDSAVNVAYSPFGSKDTFKVDDLRVDDHSAVLVWHTADNRYSGKVWDHNGANNSGATQSVAIPAGKKVYLTPCIGEYGSRQILSCGTTHFGYS